MQVKNSVKKLWSCKEVANSFNFGAAQLGAIDEKHIERFINSYYPGQKKTIVDLGIGTGRELCWLDKVKNTKSIVGVDYSKAMLDVCRGNITKGKFKTGVRLVHSDITKLKKIDLGRNNTIKIFLFLLNSFGNNEREEQIKILNSVWKLMGERDLLIMTLYKYPEKLKIPKELLKQIPKHLKGYEDKKTYEVLDYVFVSFLWQNYYKKYGKIPVFWYNEKTKNIEVYVGKKLMYISHRWNKKEIREIHGETKLRIKKIIEGDFMYVSIAEKK